MDGGLPYDDSTNPDPAFAPIPVIESNPNTDNDGDHPMLDRPLDDYVHDPEPVPEHVQSLLGRMGKNKIYLVEESPGIIHRDPKIRGDPRIADLAKELEEQDPSIWLAAVAKQSESPIKTNALFLSSELIKHLSTSKIFTWATGRGAAVMGIEWLNDTTLLLIFPDASSTLIGLSVLSKAGFDPREGDDPLLERSAHPFPISLFPLASTATDDSPYGDDDGFDSPRPRDRPPHVDDSSDNAEVEVVDEDGIRRKGRGAFGRPGRSLLASSDRNERFDLAPLATGNRKEDLAQLSLAPGIDPNERITIRYAAESDYALRRQAKQSEWYKRHGREAGKEVSSTPRRSERDEVRSLSDRVGTLGEGREFAKRIGRERERERRGSPYSRPAPQRKGKEDLDAELERMTASRLGGSEGGEAASENDSWGKPPRRETRGREDLDKELDELFAARSSTAS